MGCWEEIDVASASAIPTRWGTERFVEFTVECDTTVAAFSRAYVDNQMVEKRLPLYRNSEVWLGDWVGHDARLASVSILSFVFDERLRSGYT